MLLGSRVHLALGDLAFFIEPRLAANERADRQIRPWAGLAVILSLALALAFVGQQVTWAMHEVLPRREVQQ